MIICTTHLQTPNHSINSQDASMLNVPRTRKSTRMGPAQSVWIFLNQQKIRESVWNQSVMTIKWLTLMVHVEIDAQITQRSSLIKLMEMKTMMIPSYNVLLPIVHSGKLCQKMELASNTGLKGQNVIIIKSLQILVNVSTVLIITYHWKIRLVSKWFASRTR
jgi:hypothetical protein